MAASYIMINKQLEIICNNIINCYLLFRKITTATYYTDLPMVLFVNSILVSEYHKYILHFFCYAIVCNTANFKSISWQPRQCGALKEDIWD